MLGLTEGKKVEFDSQILCVRMQTGLRHNHGGPGPGSAFIDPAPDLFLDPDPTQILSVLSRISNINLKKLILFQI